MRPVLAGLAVQAAAQAPAHEMTAPVGGCGAGRDDDRGAAAGPGLQRPVDDAVVLRGHHSDGVTQALLEHGDQVPERVRGVQGRDPEIPDRHLVSSRGAKPSRRGDHSHLQRESYLSGPTSAPQ